MRRQVASERGDRRPARAFTLIELLVVITIIGVLVSILVPAVSSVRSMARTTASSATISTLETGLEQFKADGRIGGAYPPSLSDADGSTGSPTRGQVRSPFAQSLGLTRDFTISGAGLLVWALAGADRLGSPGFRPIRPGKTLWSSDTDDIQGRSGPDQPSVSGAYAIYGPNDPDHPNQPMQARSGPYVDASKVPMSEFDRGASQFVVPTEGVRSGVGNSNGREYPMFLDGFGFPILYYRADAAGVLLADNDPTVPNFDQNHRGKYHWVDNGLLLDHASGVDLHFKGFDGEHAMEFMTGYNYTVQNPFPRGTFQGFIRNEAVSAKLEPHRVDSFLLVSPGKDGRYGTADDVTNFPHNGK